MVDHVIDSEYNAALIMKTVTKTSPTNPKQHMFIMMDYVTQAKDKWQEKSCF